MEQYDYIIVGAGSAGAVLAARLTEDPRTRVLLLEAGRANHIYSRLPVSFGLLIHHPGANWLYESDPEPGTANRAIPVPRGKLLGGSSAINGLVWVRGQPLDYDTWAQMGARGWSWQDVAPVFDRIEDFETRGAQGRGNGGPLHVSIVPDQNPLYDALFKAATQAGYRINPDYNSEDQEGISKTQASIKRGRRMSVSHCYLDPARRRPNLNIVTEVPARRVVLEGRRCAGVVYERWGKRIEARANREVILSAGAIATPQLLELSGIGRPEILKAHGIEVAHALPAVGENFRDHINARIIWRVKEPRRFLQHQGPRRRRGYSGAQICSHRRRFPQPAVGTAGRLSQDAARSRHARRPNAPDPVLHQGPQAPQAAGFPVHDGGLLPAAPGEPGDRPHPLRRPRCASRDPLQLPRRQHRPAHHGRRLPHDAPHRRVACHGSPARRGVLARQAGGERRPDPVLDPQQLADGLSSHRHLPHGAGTEHRGRREAEACTASSICASPTRPSSPPCRPGNTNAPSIMVGEKAADLIRSAA